ncbi:hypothetical protein GCM10011586_30230 [Silvibacterium dinghuense]|nr:hypothetical protein GCM10011586_30230 [Silvibacterium dinghuense]
MTDGSTVFDDVESFSVQGSVAIIDIHGKWRIIDAKGHNVLPGEYDFISHFDKDGPALFLLESWEKNTETVEGVCDSSGQILIPVKYREVHYIPAAQRFIVTQNNKDFLFDANGHNLMETGFDSISKPFAGEKNSLWVVREGPEEGAIAPATGHLLIPLGKWLLQSRGPFIIAEQDDAQGVFDHDGKPILPMAEDQQISWWEEGHLLIVNTGSGETDDSYALNADLQEVIPHHRYAVMKPYGKRLAIYSNEKWGLLSPQLAVIVAPQYSAINELHQSDNSLFLIDVPKQEGAHQYGVIDSNGKIILSPAWENINLKLLPANTPAADGDKRADVPAYYIVSKGQRFGLLSATGDTLLPTEFDSIESLDEDDPRLVATRNNRAELVDGRTGKQILPPDYEELSLLDGYSDLFLAKNSGKLGVITASRETLIPFAYDAFVDGDSLEHTLLLSQHGQTHRFTLIRSNDHWATRSTTQDVLGLPCDTNPVVNITRAKTTECYLPKPFSHEQQVLDGSHNGLLREATWPSLLLSQTQAFIFLGEFATAELPLLPNTLPLCRDTKGFSILLTSKSSQDDPTLCQSSSLHRLTFIRTTPTTLHCNECSEHNIPDTWIRYDMQAH